MPSAPEEEGSHPRYLGSFSWAGPAVSLLALWSLALDVRVQCGKRPARGMLKAAAGPVLIANASRFSIGRNRRGVISRPSFAFL